MKVKRIISPFCKTLFLLMFLVMITSCKRTEKEYYQTGKIKLEKTYRGKALNGLYRMWYVNGQLQQQAVYKDDKLDGKLENWYPDGTKQSEETYADGVKSGKMFNWDVQGNKIEEKTYLNDSLDGSYKIWYPSGVPRIEGEYRKGMFHGKWKYYNEYGMLVGEGSFVDGTGVLTGYSAPGRKNHEVHYVKNLKDGEETEYLPDGSVKLKKIFKKDKIENVHKE